MSQIQHSTLSPTDASTTAPCIETYQSAGEVVIRRIRTSSGRTVVSSLKRIAEPSGDPAADFDLAWLRAAEPPERATNRGAVRIADLFSGCGGMSVGVSEAARALKMSADFVL